MGHLAQMQTLPYLLFDKELTYNRYHKQNPNQSSSHRPQDEEHLEIPDLPHLTHLPHQTEAWPSLLQRDP